LYRGMMIGSYPYLMNPSGMGGVYAAAVASQPVQPITATSGQTFSPAVQFGGALAGQQASGGASASGSQSSSSAYTPGSTLNIMA
jgi:hypothetical protein